LAELVLQEDASGIHQPLPHENLGLLDQLRAKVAAQGQVTSSIDYFRSFAAKRSCSSLIGKPSLVEKFLQVTGNRKQAPSVEILSHNVRGSLLEKQEGMVDSKLVSEKTIVCIQEPMLNQRRDSTLRHL
jgi:hypothetical protein